eukprot:TRINITY_DN1089_c0_g1_i2.p1 TRINITY_DN1089_c0_g1~~TRINITY_DN1089_c0_g1_i2.p1  ORF type:complete len:228 (+),score=101.74 TRINITY_DN1089_c0_g1_i2:117-800(+)
MSEPVKPFTDEEAASDSISKKQLVEFLHTNASSEFLKRHKLNGKLDVIVKNAKKPALVTAYQELFEKKEFRNEAAEAEAAKQADEAAKKLAEASLASKEEKKEAPKEAVKVEQPKYKKTLLKKGDGQTFPKKGDLVAVRYKGTLDDGKVFDQNVEPVKKKLPEPLKFKVGTGKVIRGWDEGLVTMSVGEKAKLVIEPEWAYGKKGMPDAGIPPNATLTFEVELLSVA